MNFHDLKVMTVAQLREVAKDIEGLTGYTQMHKDQLVSAICKKLEIETHEHHEVMGLDKRAIKERIRALKKERAAMLSAHDNAQLVRVRHEIHQLKGRLRRATI